METLELKTNGFVFAGPAGDDGDETGDPFEIDEKSGSGDELGGDMDDLDLDENEFIEESEEE